MYVPQQNHPYRFHRQRRRKKGRQRNQHRDLLARDQDVLDERSWGSRTVWHRCVAFGKLADFSGTLTKGAHVAIFEGELHSHEYQRELAVGIQKTTLAQRVWEIRVDSVLKLDRAAKTEANENQQEVPH